MKNIFSLLRLEGMKQSFFEIAKRFPLAVLIVFGVSIVFITLIHLDPSNFVEEQLLKTIFTLIITFFFSVGISLLCEDQKISQHKSLLLQLVPIVYSILFFIGFSSDINNFENFVSFLLSLFGVLSFLFFAPYLKNLLQNKTEQTNYYHYFYKVSIIFFISTILGVLLFGLGALGITAVFELFDLSNRYSDEVYADWAVFAMSFFAPLYALTQFPTSKTFHKPDDQINTFYGFIVKYIAIPAIYIYFIILYAYSIRLILSFPDWPKGEVSWMVIGFSILGYISYILSYIYESQHNFIRIFRKFFPYLVIPQLFVLFYAIYLRIAQYDITINRYFVVVFGIWLGVISLYFIISKKKYLGYIPLILTLFTIGISIGPWSVYNLPESRQLERLKENLIQANILNNGEITPLNDYSDIDEKLSGDIYDGIRYVCDFDQCKSIKTLFKDEYKQSSLPEKEKILNSNGSELSAWEIVRNISVNIKVRAYYATRNENNNPYVYLYNDFQDSQFPINITGYNQLLRLNFSSRTNEISYATLSSDTNQINIYINNKLIESFDITEVYSSIIQKNPNIGVTQVSTKDMMYELSGELYDIKIIIENISVKNPNYSGREKQENLFQSIGGFVLLKQKD